jgi:hypothetical protein
VVIERAYRRFWTVAATLPDLPPARWLPALSTVATDPLLTQVYEGLQAQRRAGRRDFGTVVPHPRVVGLTGRTASLVDCQDASGSGELDLDSGLPTSVGAARTPLAATLRYGPGERWRVYALRYLDTEC